nr:hypothetical protein [uncultured Celeribacter sp.]
MSHAHDTKAPQLETEAGYERLTLHLSQDPHALAALRAYAQACVVRRPELAGKLQATIARLEERQRCLSIIDAATPNAHGHPLMAADEQIASAMDKLRIEISTGGK